MPRLMRHLVDLWYRLRGRPRFNLKRERRRLFPELDDDTDIEGTMWYEEGTGRPITPFTDKMYPGDPRQRPASPDIDDLSGEDLRVELAETSREMPVFYRSSEEEDDDLLHINGPVSSTAVVAADSDGDVSVLDLNV